MDDWQLILQEDGIEPVYGRFHLIGYKIPCEICGQKLIRSQYSRKRTYICDYCKGVLKKKKKLLEESETQEILAVQTKKEKSFENAIQLIKEQVNNFETYQNAIKVARTKVEKYGSIPEMMVAIELLRLKYRIIPQQKIGNRIADFVIPKEKLVIEVDGKIFHQNTEKEVKKDLYYNEMLGFDWVVIHIPADEIRLDIHKLKEVIDKSIKLAHSPYRDVYK